MGIPLIQEIPGCGDLDTLAEQLRGEPGLVLLRSGGFDWTQARFSFLTARPFLAFRAHGSRCEIFSSRQGRVCYGDPWRLLDQLVARFEILDPIDLPFPLGGCFGFWGYDLKNFIEPSVSRRAVRDLELPDACLGFYDSLLAVDHWLQRAWVISTGLKADGSREISHARAAMDWWLDKAKYLVQGISSPDRHCRDFIVQKKAAATTCSNLSREQYLERVCRAKDYIRQGDIYQVNLSHRLTAPCASGWDLFHSLGVVAPAPFGAYMDCGDFELVSSSPEQFLRLSGSQAISRPIKGTRPRSPDPERDTRLAYELQTSAKENAELVMITDLLRNDFGRVCEFGSIRVPELARLERFSHVQHLVSTVEGRLRDGTSHASALANCFPGGSITGAPKVRAMQIIDELEPVSRGPYTGALGYLGFNRESQLSIVIRSAVCKSGRAWFHVGAGIVADSDPAAEYVETMDKARGFFEAVETSTVPDSRCSTVANGSGICRQMTEGDRR